MTLSHTTTVRPALPAVLLVPLLATAPAADAASGIIARIGVDAGGEELQAVQFTDGERDGIEAGAGVHLVVGGRLAVGDSGLESDLTVGYKFDSVDADNGEIAFSRVTLDALQFLRLGGRFRVGGGLTYELSPTVDVEGPNGFGGRIDDSTEADGAFGYVVAADYLVGRSVELGLRATFIEYDFERASSIDGDSVGGYLTYRF